MPAMCGDQSGRCTALLELRNGFCGCSAALGSAYSNVFSIFSTAERLLTTSHFDFRKGDDPNAAGNPFGGAGGGFIDLLWGMGRHVD